MLRLLRRELQAHSIHLHCPPLLPFPFTRFLSSLSSSSADANSALVLSALRSHGVPDDLCETIFSKQPNFRTIRVDKNLSPKLAFLRSEGFSGPELAEILLHNPSLLLLSLDRSLTPSVTLLKSIFPSKEGILRVLKHSNKSLTPNLLANVKFLKDHGFSQDLILRLILFQPRSLMRTPGDFVDTLEYLKKLIGNPTSTGTAFVIALGTLSYMSKSTFQRKLELYKELGWTEEEVLKMFKLQPTTLAASDETITKKVSYYRDTMGWGPEFLCLYPSIINMSLEKRIIPRCAVLNLLMSNGLLKRNARPGPKFIIGEKTFVENYVKKYEESVPGIVGAYEGKIKFRGWDWLKDAKNQPEAT